MEKKLQKILVCPKCLGGVKIGEKIICRDCGQEMKFFDDKPLMTVSERIITKKSPMDERLSFDTDIVVDIGAGARSTGAINVDIRPLPNIDVVANALYLPFRDRSIGRVLLNQVIEHFNHEEVIRLLEELKRTIAPGGTIELWTPNFQAFGSLAVWLFSGIDRTNPRLPLLYAPLTGGQDYPENVHKSYWTKKLLKLYFEKAGLIVEEIATDQRFAKKFHPGWIVRALFPLRRGQLYLRARKLPESGLTADLEPVKLTNPWIGYQFPK